LGKRRWEWKAGIPLLGWRRLGGLEGERGDLKTVIVCKAMSDLFLSDFRIVGQLDGDVVGRAIDEDIFDPIEVGD